jgi:hypothetical protein
MRALLDPQAVIARFGADLAGTIRRERRTAMKSPLFDLPGRSSLGFAVTYALAPEFIERLEAELTGAEAGALMREPLSRPYFLQLFILVEGYLAGREQVLLDTDGAFRTPAEAGGDRERTARVVSWFAEACEAYRQDGELFPGDHVLGQPVLSEPQLQSLLEASAVAASDAERVRKAFGQLELYAITLHGEQRDGIFDHGPYRHEARTLAVHEVNDLDNDYLPWADAETQLGVDAVGAVRAYPPAVAMRFDLFGTMSPDPVTATGRDLALRKRDRDGIAPLGLDELEALAERARLATTILYRRFAAWDPAYRIRYGAGQFLNHLVPFARLASSPGLESWLTAAGDAAAEAEMPRLEPGQPRSIWSHFATTDRIFTPVAE